MKLSGQRVKKLCARQGVTLRDLLQQAGVSRTAYYSLVRRESVIPDSVHAIAAALAVAPRTLLDESPADEVRTRALLREARRILARNPKASFDNVWHTLVLLDEPPVERLRRSLLRGQPLDLH